MASKISERRMAENEVVFREYNETLTKGLRRLQLAAKESQYEADAADIKEALYFFCECSDENCHERIPLTVTDYEKIHHRRNRFVIRPGHEAKIIERVIKTNKHFSVVDKFETPSEATDGLNATSFNNV